MSTIADRPVPETPPGDAVDAPRDRGGTVPGETGIWVFIGADLVVFAALFVAFLYDRSDAEPLFAQGQTHLNVTFGVVNTALLLTSSLFVAIAVRGLRQRTLTPRTLQRLVMGAFAAGIGFSVLKVLEYSDKVDHGFKPLTDDFFMYYFVLTGLHWFHLAIGLAGLTAMWFIAGRSTRSPAQVRLFESGASFWHMVDLVWIVLFPLVYLVH